MSWLKLKRPMDEAANADYGDIVNAKRALLQLGYYQPPGGGAIGAWVDGPLFEGIRRFQRDNRLKVDGVMRPGGPTEAAMNRRLSGREMSGEPDKGMPVIIPPQVDNNMPVIKGTIQPSPDDYSGPYVDENGNIHVDGIHPKTRKPIYPPRGPF